MTWDIGSGKNSVAPREMYEWLISGCVIVPGRNGIMHPKESHVSPDRLPGLVQFVDVIQD